MAETKKEIVIIKDAPFTNCKFERQDQANILENVIKYTKDNVVINLTAPWGYGKTTFLKMLMQQMNNNDIATIYFSAWEYDYVEDPFSALIGHINKELNTNEQIREKEQIKSLFDKALPIVGNIGLKILTANVLSTDTFKDLIDKEDQGEITTTIGNYSGKVLSQFMETSNTIENFKTDLAAFANLQNEKQIVIIVDELDRCRPDFSIEMLERIKHIMSVPGIKFILGTDNEQLVESIKVLYGNNFDSTKYLERFIDFEYRLEIPQLKQFINLMIDEYKIISIIEVRNFDNIQKEDLIIVLTQLFKESNLDLRAIKQIFFHLNITMTSIPKAEYYDYSTNKTFVEYLTYKLIQNKIKNQFISKENTSFLRIYALDNFYTDNFNQDDFEFIRSSAVSQYTTFFEKLKVEEYNIYQERTLFIKKEDIVKYLSTQKYFILDS